MKKILSLFTICTLCAVGTLSAQVSIRAGYNNTNMKIKGTYIETPVTLTSPITFNGCYLGAAYNLNVCSIGIEPALMINYYSKEGTIFCSKGTWRWVDANIPINLNYSYSSNPSIKLTALVGPIFNIGILSKVHAKLNNGKKDKLDNYSDEDKTDLFNRFGVDINAGLRVTILQQIGIEANYTIGLTNRLKEEYVDDDGSMKFNHLRLGFIYTF